MNPSPVASAASASVAGFSNGRYLLFAGIFHVTVTSLVYALGRAKIFPALFDRNGVGSFASDSADHLADAVTLVQQFQQTGIAGWASAPSPLHTKLYSLFFAAFGPLVGFNILSAEPLNLLCYLAIIFSVYKLGNESAGPRAGRLAAIVVALWPTFLLHTTQVLKDPMFIALLLGLIFISTCWITRSFSITRGLCSGLLSGALAMLMWLIKPGVWPLPLMVVLLSTGFQCLRFIRAKQIVNGNVIGGITLLAIALGVPALGPRLIRPYRAPNPHPLLTTSETGHDLPVRPPSRSSPPLTKLRGEIDWARYLFVTYPGTSSNIDADVRLDSWGEVIRYLPRATEIGLFAPFPNMWLATGAQVGRLGRMLSGLETLMIYVFIGLSFWCLWRRRDQLAIWFLLTIATLSVTLLALVIANIGALYRMRYPFWFLLIIVGVDGALRLQRSGAITRLRRRAS